MGTKTAPVGGLGCFRFRREEHLKGRSDIREVFRRGRRVGGPGVKLFVLKNSLPYNRICFTFARGFGNAVERNRSRRLGREAWRHLRPRLLGGYDLILLVYPEAPKKAANGSAVANGSPPVQRAGTCSKSGFAARTEQLALLLSKAGLLR